MNYPLSHKRPPGIRLPAELILEILEHYMGGRGRTSVVVALLIHPSITARLYPLTYRHIRIRKHSALRSLHGALQHNPTLSRYIRDLEFRFLPFNPHNTDPESGKDWIALYHDSIMYQIQVLSTIAPHIQKLVLRMDELHPAVLHCIQTTAFPNLIFLHCSYFLLLNAENTIRLHSEIQQDFHTSFHPGNVLLGPRLHLETVTDSWTFLVRLHMTIDTDEVLSSNPLLARLPPMDRLRQLSISFHGEGAAFYLDYLEKFNVPANLQGMIVLMRLHWSPSNTFQIPFPSLSQRLHPTLIFGSRTVPFFNRPNYRDPPSVTHLSTRVFSYGPGTSWDRLWVIALRLIELNKASGQAFKCRGAISGT
ncbi:hypothetical protein VNI00_010815 [Paramarasmius palmivorus]|uniref:Uncharacterized protein n=1 Tax=Paramarasmius palmivorus TaxID=297713 RepID=A0AAW0CGA7_9AGAR